MGFYEIGAAPWHLKRPEIYPSTREQLEIMKEAYYAAVKSARLRPPTVPWQVVSYFLLAGFFMIDHRNNYLLYQCRWLVWFTIVYIEYNNLMYSSSIEPATGYMTGMLAVWAVIWSSVWLVWTRPQFTARRVERRPKKKALQHVNGYASDDERTDEDRKPKLDAKGRRVSFAASGWDMPDHKSSANLGGANVNGDITTAPVSEAEESAANGSKANANSEDRREKLEVELAKAKANAQFQANKDEWEYFWQPYPDTFGKRLGWVVDLILSFRGQGWNFSIPSNPPLPPAIAESLGEPVSRSLHSRVGVQRFQSRRELARYQLPKYLLCYIILDFVKMHILWDPFFRTGDHSAPAPFYLASFPPWFVLYIRRNIQLIGIITAIEFTELLAPIVFCLILGPNIMGLRGAAWQYPTTWGGFPVILSKSLNGLWGGWWHQTFRIGFAAPSNYLIRHGWMKRKSLLGQIIQLSIAFFISGSLHVCASITQLPVTEPWGPLRFFMAQVPGILLQAVFCAIFQSQINKTPMWARKTCNLLFSMVWLFATSGPFVDDMCRGGVWLFEPLPWSPLRALGLGPHGESMWPWKGIYGAYWESPVGRWWESGWALFM